MGETMRFLHKFSENRIKKLAMLPSGNSKMQQHLVAETDINRIISKYNKTGIITHIARAKKVYGDFTELKDVAEAMDTTTKAQAVFESLPAELRNKFGNSIPGFFEYIHDPNNREQCEQWGIFEKQQNNTPTPSEPQPTGETTEE